MLSGFKPNHSSAPPETSSARGSISQDNQPTQATSEKDTLPQHNNDLEGNEHRGPNGHHKERSKVKKEGESGRSWFHFGHFLYCCGRSSSRMSMMVNVLWPLVPVAIAVHFALPEHHVLIFTLNYLAMIPAANLIGYAGQELGRKLPHVFGVLVETTLGSVVEIVLFSVLVAKDYIDVVRAAIVGSILANLLFCLGLCFVAGGLRHQTSAFHEVIAEVGNGLMLVAATALVLPAAFASATTGTVDPQPLILQISRATAIVLLLAFVVYIYFNMSSHHGLVSEVLEADELKDRDRHEDLTKKKLTFTECIVALVVAITCVSLIAVFLVLEIEFIVERGVSDAFMGLILVPFVEKFAEHLTAIDEAYDNMPNMALAHVLGACIQTALLNTPLVVIIGWGLGRQMDLNFKQFEAVILILSILVVGNFLRDGKSNYLEGLLCICVYAIVAVAAWYYPNPTGGTTEGEVAAAVQVVKRVVAG